MKFTILFRVCDFNHIRNAWHENSYQALKIILYDYFVYTFDTFLSPESQESQYSPSITAVA